MSSVTYQAAQPATPPPGVRIKVSDDNGEQVQHVNIDAMPAVVTSGSVAVVDMPPWGVVSSGNSTETPLAGGGTFTGATDDVTDYAAIIVTLTASHASATNGLKLQFSKTGAAWVTTDEYTVPANTCKTFNVQTVGPFFRVVYTNGSTQQTSFSLCAQYKIMGGLGRSHRIADGVTGQDDSDLVSAVLMAKRDGAADSYIPIDATGGGNLKVAIQEFDGRPYIPTAPADTLYMSEFAEVRVAAPGNRSDAEFIYDLQPLLFDDISSSGSATFRAASRDVLLSIASSGSTAAAGLRQRAWIPYTPGSGQEIDITGTLNAANLPGTAQVFLRSTVSGSTTVTTIDQADWTAAKTGVNWQYSQICRMSFQSLKVGRVQFALVRDGLPVKVAEIVNDNLRATGYWQYASLPPYWKLYNTATQTIVEFGYGDELNGIGFRFVHASVTTDAQAVAICETVKSQGGVPLLDMPGYPFSTPIMGTRTVSTTLLPLLSIRVAALFAGQVNRTLLLPLSFGVYTDNPVDYSVFYRPVLTNPSWVAVDATYSAMEYDISATALTGGIRIDTDFLGSGRNTVTTIGSLLGRTIMSLGSVGAADILTIAAIRATTTNANAKAFVTWKEVR